MAENPGEDQMSVKITTIAMLSQYFASVVDRAEHHAPNVKVVVYPLFAFLVSRATDFEVRGDHYKVGNVLWCWVQEQRYTFRYDYDEDEIILLRNSLQGPEIARFTNLSTVEDFRKAFGINST